MANPWARTIGQANASSPSSIQNAEHHDRSQSKRAIDGTPGTPTEILADSTTKQPVPDLSILRVTNTDTATQFLAIAADADIPVGDPDITDGYALPPNSVTHIYIGQLATKESTFIKSSDTAVQVIILEA